MLYIKSFKVKNLNTGRPTKNEHCDQETKTKTKHCGKNTINLQYYFAE